MMSGSNPNNSRQTLPVQINNATNNLKQPTPNQFANLNQFPQNSSKNQAFQPKCSPMFIQIDEKQEMEKKKEEIEKLNEVVKNARERRERIQKFYKDQNK